jgi:GlcNAc-P-P-Und epimerase
MRVLVTGADGFIGQFVCGLLEREGHQTLRLDKNPRTPSTIRCDVLDLDHLMTVVTDAQPDAVIHLAARTDLTGRSLSDYVVNIDGVINIIKACEAARSVRRILLTSTQLVCRVGYVPRNDLDFMPHTKYGQSKAEGELAARKHLDGKLTWSILRPTTIWGPGMSPHYQKFFRALKRGMYWHPGTAAPRKSFGYVENAAFQYLRILEAPAESVHGRVFYIADYEPISLRGWVDALQRELSAPKVRQLPLVMLRVAAKLGDLAERVGLRSPFNSFRLNNILSEYVFDLSGTRAVCGELPCAFERGIESTAEWIRGLD